MHSSTKLPLGHCFVVLMHSSDSQRAIIELSGKKLVGRKVTIKSVPMTDVAEHVLGDSIPPAQEAPQIIPTTSSQLETNLELKRNSQTQLARQKMEVLKAREGMPKDESQHATLLNQGTRPLSYAPQSISPKSGSLNELPAKHHKENDTLDLPPISTSKTPTFNIPGLFMEPATQELDRPSNQPTDQTQNSLPRDDKHALLSVPKGPLFISAKGPEEPSIVFVAPSTVTQEAVNPPHRKRQKAADFIDSPSVRIKRSLGHTEDTSVIIEVSDDEPDEIVGQDDEMNGDTDIEVDEDVRQSTPLQHSSPLHFEGGKAKGLKDQPPLSDIPTRKPVTPRMLGKTPPKVVTPGKGKEPQVLEIEIELMNRKIAEMQQRIIAKQNASRAQTPDKLGNPGKVTYVPKPSQEQHMPSMSGMDLAGMSKTRIHVQELERDINAPQAVTKARAASVADKTVEPSTVAEVAEVVEVTTVTTVTGATRNSEAVEASESAKVAEATEVVEHMVILADQQAEALDQAKMHNERLVAAEAAKDAEEERRRSRKTEIEVGIPVLDAELEKATQKLHFLKKQMEDLEIEVQKGIEGRRALIDELTGLSASLPFVNMPQNDLSGTNRLLLGMDVLRRGEYLFPQSNRI